jgi:hypothetical protein
MCYQCRDFKSSLDSLFALAQEMIDCMGDTDNPPDPAFYQKWLDIHDKSLRGDSEEVQELKDIIETLKANNEKLSDQYANIGKLADTRYSRIKKQAQRIAELEAANPPGDGGEG